MHQTSPGVDRAVEAATRWAERLGSAHVRLVDLLLGLLDEEEGRPWVMLQRLGLPVETVRDALTRSADAGQSTAPPVSALFNDARAWSLAHRADPVVLTDAFLLAVLRTDPVFRQAVAPLGLDPVRLEALISTPETRPTVLASEASTFALPDTTAEMDAGRVVDANFNRAREALRVLEDYCRFVLDDRFLTEQVKGLRHGLADASGRLPPGLLLSARETLRDVGTAVSASGEYERGSPQEVAAVNLKRVQESLRSLEEYGKLFTPELGRQLEALRYTSYTLERAVVRGSTARQRLATAKLYVLLTGGQCVASLDWTIEQAAAGGASVFQLREKALADQELLERARNVRRWTRTAGVLFIVNDRPDIVRLAEADGVHLGQDDLSVKDARRILGPDPMIGVSTHSLEQVRRAVLDGADYVGIGPTFPSRTKHFDHFPGLEFIRAATAETSLPAFALGGIAPESIAEAVRAGATRVAVGSAVTQSEDPAQTCRVLLAALGG
jgi:thiamine-phosphate pyrophosphorylase